MDKINARCLTTFVWAQRWDWKRRGYCTGYKTHIIGEEKCEQMGFAKCPFEQSKFDVADGRNASIHNSGFGTAYGIVDGKPLPLCDSAGFAPFGFGYRRCPGEQLTIQVFEDFLRKVWKSGIEFHKLDIANPEPLPIGRPPSSATMSASPAPPRGGRSEAESGIVLAATGTWRNSILPRSRSALGNPRISRILRTH